MLPQELRELGTEEAIIFAKGVKPIHADKIRWYKDPEFKGRPLAAPEVPVAPVSTAGPILMAEPDGGDPGEVEALYEKPLSPFKLDFSDVEIPKGPISEDEAEDLADKLYAAMTR